MSLPNSIEARDIAAHLHPYTDQRAHAHSGPLMMERGEGVYLYGPDGRRYIEAMAGLWSVAVGFGEKRLVEAATRQMERLPFSHTFTHMGHEPSVLLAEKLLSMAPVPMSKVFFTNSGSEANDTAMKMLWYRSNAMGEPDRKKFIARRKGYHGVTMASASLTGLVKNHKSFDLPLDFVHHTTCPHYRTEHRDGESERDFSARCAQELEELILREGPETFAGFFAEPVMAAGGVIVPPDGYWDEIQPVLKKYGILLIADEVVCGFGRTGETFGTVTYGLQPDIMTLSKQLSSSYFPISALLVSEAVFAPLADRSHEIGTFGHGYTASGHPVGCAVALENIAIIEERDLIGQVREISPHFLGRLHQLAEHSAIVETRGIGLIGAMEFRLPDGAPIGSRGAEAKARMIEKGVITRNVDDSVAFCPPLIIGEAQIDEIFDAAEETIREMGQA